MAHEISTTTGPLGSVALVADYARAICARGAQTADTFAMTSNGRASGAMRREKHALQPIFTKNRGGPLLIAVRSAARSIINDNAYANRRAPPGGNPGRSRHREPDRGV
jgi:hypothetical protein